MLFGGCVIEGNLQVPVIEYQIIPVPRGAKVLSGEVQRAVDIVMYCLVDKDEKRMDELEVITCGTGHEAKVDNKEFVGTVAVHSFMYSLGGVVLNEPTGEDTQESNRRGVVHHNS